MVACMSVPTQAGMRLVQSISGLLVLHSATSAQRGLTSQVPNARAEGYLWPISQQITQWPLSYICYGTETSEIFYHPCLLWGQIICRRRQKRHSLPMHVPIWDFRARPMRALLHHSGVLSGLPNWIRGVLCGV